MYGIALDTDLTWEIIIGLCANDVVDDSTVEDMSRRDPSATGVRHAATARASRPTSASKSQTFTRMVDDANLPNSELRALALGFGTGLQTNSGDTIAAEAPLRSFADEYFARVAGWWETRTLEMAQTMTLRLYPPVSSATVDATSQWLDDHPQRRRAWCG